jgi:hypothetical protein
MVYSLAADSTDSVGPLLQSLEKYQYGCNCFLP